MGVCSGGLFWGAVLVNTTSMDCSDKYNLNGLFWGAVLGGCSGGLIAGSVAHMHPVHLGSATCVICLPVGWVPIWQFGTILPPWQSLHRSQFWVAEIICAPLPGVVRHALYAITLWVVAGSVFSFRTGTRSVGWAVAMGWPWRGCSGCGWCRLLGVQTDGGAGSVVHMLPVHLGGATCMICLPVGWVPIWRFGTSLPPCLALYGMHYIDPSSGWPRLFCAPMPGVVRHALYVIMLWVVAVSVFSVRRGACSVGWAMATGWPWRGGPAVGGAGFWGYRHTDIQPFGLLRDLFLLGVL